MQPWEIMFIFKYFNHTFLKLNISANTDFLESAKKCTWELYFISLYCERGWGKREIKVIKMKYQFMIFQKRIPWLAGRISRKTWRKGEPQRQGSKESSNILVLAGLPLTDSVTPMSKPMTFVRGFCKPAWQPFLGTQAPPILNSPY